MKRKNIAQAVFLLLLVVGTVFVIRRHNAELQWQTDEGEVFGTFYSFKYLSKENHEAELMAALKEVDGSLSMFNSESTISRINDNRSDSSDFLLEHVFTLSQRVSEATGGAFDVTVAPLVNAWGFGRKRGELPDSATVDSLRRLVGWQRVSIRDGRVNKEDPRMVMDFSAVAKGFGCDQVARRLDALGVENYMIWIGGEVVVHGRNDKGKLWRVGVNKPSETDETQTVIECDNEAMATSGNYRNYYEEGGVRVAHTISPFTGRPVQHSLLSATVFAPTCAEADAFATAFMVLGMEGAQEILEKEKQLRAYLIYDTGDSLAVWQSVR